MCLQESKKVEMNVFECLILQTELVPDASDQLVVVGCCSGLDGKSHLCSQLKIRWVEGAWRYWQGEGAACEGTNTEHLLVSMEHISGVFIRESSRGLQHNLRDYFSLISGLKAS